MVHAGHAGGVVVASSHPAGLWLIQREFICTVFFNFTSPLIWVVIVIRGNGHSWWRVTLIFVSFSEMLHVKPCHILNCTLWIFILVLMEPLILIALLDEFPAAQNEIVTERT